MNWPTGAAKRQVFEGRSSHPQQEPVAMSALREEFCGGAGALALRGAEFGGWGKWHLKLRNSFRRLAFCIPHAAWSCRHILSGVAF